MEKKNFFLVVKIKMKNETLSIFCMLFKKHFNNLETKLKAKYTDVYFFKNFIT